MEPQYSFKDIEPALLAFWEEHQVYKKQQAKGAQGKPFYYLDGPPYTSGHVHLGTAWGKALRDMILRYKRMRGFRVWDRAGFDMHGLPTENKVAAKLKLKRKEDIEKYGLDKFNKECESFTLEIMQGMIQDFKRLGVWMGFEDPYKPIDPDFIEGVWWLTKKAHEKKRLYEGKKTMHWCPRCATALAKHDLEYEHVEENSIFLKFQTERSLKKDVKEYLIIWTTTPWTIPFNMAIMANPEVDYIKAQVGKEIWILAKNLAGVFINGLLGKEFTTIEEFKGSSLEGLRYVHPLADKIPYFTEQKKQKKLHTVVLSREYVDTSAGSGLVHCAPGCGPEDYEVGHKEGLEPFNELDEYGAYSAAMGPFAGLKAKTDDKQFIEALKKAGALVTSTKIEHDYPHCNRCHGPVVFRTTTQWFFKVEDLKNRMLHLNEKVHWVPKAAFNAFDSWLRNLRDNGITRQRYWGTPVPIWRCESCEAIEVIGSRAELKEKSGKLPENLHRPWIDELTMPCACGKRMHRITDIFDVWVDAGTTSWSCLRYPQEEQDFKTFFPADLILEGKDQIRGWFNLLLICSILALDDHPYKAVYMHGFIQDAKGRKMSKSLGNIISPYEVIDKYGADTFRYYSIGATSPGLDLNYNFEDMEIKHKNLLILWNLHKYVIELSRNINMRPTLIDPETLVLANEEHYILSRYHSTIAKVTELLDAYRLNEVPGLLESLFLDISRTYIQAVRERASLGTDQERSTILWVLYTTIKGVLVLLAPIIPFMTEQMFQHFKEEFGLNEESIHLLDWPEPDKKRINAQLEEDMAVAQDIVATVLGLREKLQIGLRWPILEVVIDTKQKAVSQSLKHLTPFILTQVNSKTIQVRPVESGLEVKPDYKQIAEHFGSEAGTIITYITEHSDQVIKDLQDGKDEFTVGKNTVHKQFLDIKRIPPDNMVYAEFKHGAVFVTTTQNTELKAEGFAREAIRRVQQLRKDSGLVQTDNITLLLVADEELGAYLRDWQKTIADKCGAEKILITDNAQGAFHFERKVKIKDKQLTIYFNKQ